MNLLDSINSAITRGAKHIHLSPKRYRTLCRSLQISIPPGPVKPGRAALKYRGATISTQKQE